MGQMEILRDGCRDDSSYQSHKVVLHGDLGKGYQSCRSRGTLTLVHLSQMEDGGGGKAYYTSALQPRLPRVPAL